MLVSRMCNSENVKPLSPRCHKLYFQDYIKYLHCNKTIRNANVVLMSWKLNHYIFLMMFRQQWILTLNMKLLLTVNPRHLSSTLLKLSCCERHFNCNFNIELLYNFTIYTYILPDVRRHMEVDLCPSSFQCGAG